MSKGLTMERTRVRTKIWLVNGSDAPIMGEGMAALLRAIMDEGSLNRACRKVNISYKHAWLLLKEMEESAGEPVIIRKRGGKCQGTTLTGKARQMLDDYDAYQNMLGETVYDKTFWEVIGLKISARNQMKGTVTDIETGDIVAKVKIRIEPTTITAVITREAAVALDIKKDDRVTAIVKATEVMIGTD